jgi:hypothetical protein
MQLRQPAFASGEPYNDIQVVPLGSIWPLLNRVHLKKLQITTLHLNIVVIPATQRGRRPVAGLKIDPV